MKIKTWLLHIKKSKDPEKPQENEGKELQEKSEKQAEIKQLNITKQEEKEEKKEINEENKENESSEEEHKEVRGIIKRRMLINDDSWKEFRIPQAQGNPFYDYSQMGSSFFMDVSNWDVHSLMKELEMFDPELKNDLYYRHKVELFMKINDRDYRYPRVSQKEMLRPEEILAIQLNPAEIERDAEDEEEKEGEK